MTGARPDVRIWDPGTGSLADSLAPPVLACIENGNDIAAEIESVSSCLNPQGLLLSVTTPVACRQNIARPFAAAIGRRLQLSEETLERVASAVQEAAVNAAVHGNLELGSELRQSLEGLDAYAAAMEQRLADPALAGRRVRLRANWASPRIIVDIHDDGAGDGGAVPETIDADAAKSGRGLAMLRLLSNGVSRGGHSRVVHLFFDRA